MKQNKTKVSKVAIASKEVKPPVKLALAMIVKDDDEEAKYLASCLARVARHVDAIFVTITGRAGVPMQNRVKEVCEMYNANISMFTWVDDFSAARNFNFSQVPKEYTHILWLDADDGLRGAEKLKPTLIDHPEVDVFSVYYLYAFDEYRNPTVVHPKTQIVKNDGCVTWIGALHEDFKENRELTRFLIKGIERIHLSKPEHFEAAKIRNLEIARKQLEKEPSDPRSYWNVGNALKALGQNEEAIKMLEGFILRSKSDDEKYIARLRLAESHWALGKRDQAIDHARMAIGTMPNYPDAYHLLGSLYYESKQFQKAADMYKVGLVKKPPYYTIMVYNPRDYDYVPLNNLAKCYFALSLPSLALECLKGCAKIYPQDVNIKRLIRLMRKEAIDFDAVSKIVVRLKKITDKTKLLKELNKIPSKYQAHPAVCNVRNTNFIKETSSGKDVVFYCGFTSEEWSPATAKTKGIGGSEEAIIWLSKLLKERGWNVTVYANMGHKEEIHDGVVWRPFWSWNYRDKQDAVVLWRHPKMADYEINCKNIYLDLHDVLQEAELTEPRLAKITKIFVKSMFHRSLFPNVPDDKFVVARNGIDFKTFDRRDVTRDPMLMINTSSPDRSLEALVECFAEVKKEVPEAKLKWAYGWNVFDYVHADSVEIMDWKAKMQARMKELGIEEVGRLSHGEIAELYLKAGIFAYPSEFAEIDCISLSKAQAAGAYPITSDFSALGEKKPAGGYFIHSSKTKDDWSKNRFEFSLSPDLRPFWVAEAIKQLKNPLTEQERNDHRMVALVNYSWSSVTDHWHNELNRACGTN